MTVPESIAAAQKSRLDTTFELLNKTVSAFEKLTELNVQAARSGLAENQQIIAQAFEAGAPQKSLVQQAGDVQPAIEKAQSYWRQVHEITSSARAEFAAVAQAQLKQYQLDAQSYAEKLAQNAPAGSTGAMTAWKTFITTLIDTANTAYDAATKVAQQAGEIAEDAAGVAASGSAKRPRQLPAPTETSGK